MADENTLAYIAIPVVFILGFLGSVIPPFLSRLKKVNELKLFESGAFIFLQGFAAGIVLAVAFVHSFPEGNEKIESQNPEYPYAGLIALCGVLLTLMIETTIHGLVGGHSHEKGVEVDSMHEKKRKFYTEMLILLFGLSFHSLIVGFTLGLTPDDLALFLAIIAHQFFEGLALGFRISRAQLKKGLTILLLDILFSLATPVGIAIGLIVKEAAGESPEFEFFQGVCDSLSCGILIYVGLVHMLSDEFEYSGINESKLKQIYIYSGLLLGAAVMCVIAIWA